MTWLLNHTNENVSILFRSFWFFRFFENLTGQNAIGNSWSLFWRVCLTNGKSIINKYQLQICIEVLCCDLTDKVIYFKVLVYVNQFFIQNKYFVVDQYRRSSKSPLVSTISKSDFNTIAQLGVTAKRHKADINRFTNNLFALTWMTETKY